VGVYVSSGIGGFDIIEREHWKLVQGGPGKISPFFIPSAIVTSPRDTFRFATGRADRIPPPPRHAPPPRTPSGFLQNYRAWRGGMMICGGTEATITPMGVGGFAAMKRFRRAMTIRRTPAVLGMQAATDLWSRGWGILTLESLEHAQKRNAPILAEIVGYGMSGDAYHITQPARMATALTVS